MPTSVEKIYEEAMSLPNESKAILAERIVEYLETHVNPDLERIHLDTVKLYMKSPQPVTPACFWPGSRT